MALEFPISASIGEQYQSGSSKAYTFNGTVWEASAETLDTGSFALKTENNFEGNQTINGSVVASALVANLMMNPQDLPNSVLIPTGYNALLIGPVGTDNNIVVEENALLVIL